MLPLQQRGLRGAQGGRALIPRQQASDYRGGSIQAVDLATGEVETLYTRAGDIPLRVPNDLIFDNTGGFWFADHGRTRERDEDRTGVFYAQPGGSSIEEKIFPLNAPNGIGLSPDETRLYVAETHTGRVWYWNLVGPGEIVSHPRLPKAGYLLSGLPGLQLLDSLAVDSSGNVCVATIANGGITTITPDGRTEHLATDDSLTTNICFGGELEGEEDVARELAPFVVTRVDVEVIACDHCAG